MYFHVTNGLSTANYRIFLVPKNIFDSERYQQVYKENGQKPAAIAKGG